MTDEERVVLWCMCIAVAMALLVVFA